MLSEYTYTGQAFGSDYSVSLVTHTKNTADAAMQKILREISHYNSLCSRFIPDSELSRLNQSKDMIVSPELYHLASTALYLSEKTQGVFNPLLQVAELGYDISFTKIPKRNKPAPDNPPIYSADISTVRLLPTEHRIVLAPTQKLDFGGILKGYLADKCANYIAGHETEIKGVIVNFGGDIATCGTDIEGKEFGFSIYNPITKTDIPEIKLENTCLVTSGTYKRIWSTETGLAHHIVDGTTKQNPTTDLVSVSIIYKDGGYAEAFAKTFLVAGCAQAFRILSPYTFYYLAIYQNGTIETNITNL